jgi:hypothetical protein
LIDIRADQPLRVTDHKEPGNGFATDRLSSQWLKCPPHQSGEGGGLIVRGGNEESAADTPQRDEIAGEELKPDHHSGAS